MKQKRRGRHTKRRPRENKGRDWKDAARAEAHLGHRKQEEAGKDPSLEPAEGAWSCQP